MKLEELEKLNIETEHGIFTPIYIFEEYDIKNEEYIGFKITKTAQEVYEEWLANKDKIFPVKPTTEEHILTLERVIADLEIKLL